MYWCTHIQTGIHTYKLVLAYTHTIMHTYHIHTRIYTRTHTWRCLRRNYETYLLCFFFFKRSVMQQLSSSICAVCSIYGVYDEIMRHTYWGVYDEIMRHTYWGVYDEIMRHTYCGLHTYVYVCIPTRIHTWRCWCWRRLCRLLLFSFCCTTALLLLYYCFTTALLLLYYCFTAALLLRYCCFTAALLQVPALVLWQRHAALHYQQNRMVGGLVLHGWTPRGKVAVQ